MGWSTKEVADLAGTTLKSVRHYHEVGLLDEPVRKPNGYKQYGVVHLVRLVQIKRLTDLGFSLAQIAAMGQSRDHPAEALQTLDAELAATIDRLQRARVELAAIMRDATPTDLPPALAESAAELSTADRTFVSFASTVLTPTALDAYGELIRNAPKTSADAEFDTLPADADDATKADLAARMAPYVHGLAEQYPEVFESSAAAIGQQRFARAFRIALTELYNPAQLDVMRRIFQ